MAARDRHRDLDGIKVSEATTPIPARFEVDRGTGSENLVSYAHLVRELDGTHPFATEVEIQGPVAARDLLPADAVIERCFSNDRTVRVLAKVSGGSTYVASCAAVTFVQISAASQSRADELAAFVGSIAPEQGGDVEMSVWFRTDRTINTIRRKLEAPAWSDVSMNYPGFARTSIERLLGLKRPADTGKLLLLHGPPGTGKTTAVRALARAWAPWCEPHYISDPEKFFQDTGYLTSVMASVPRTAGPTLDKAALPGQVWRLIIAEDSDEFLRASARRDAGAALGRLLNLTDGILGQGANVLVLLTTNEELTRLHPALTRPGRCLASVEFRPFHAHEATAWLGQTVNESMSLAELFERRGEVEVVRSVAEVIDTTGQYL